LEGIKLCQPGGGQAQQQLQSQSASTEQQQQASMSSTHLMSNWMSKFRRQAMQREQP